MTKIILVLALGLVLIVVEVLIPSGGVVGIIAGACIVGAVAWAFSISTAAGIKVLAFAAFLVPAMVMVALKLLPNSPILRKFVAQGFSFGEGQGTDARNPTLLGREGTVESPLRPAGMARIDGQRVDVVSRGEMIGVGVPVKVIQVQGNRVVVARIEVEEAAEETA